jgi:hypothetical protein
MAVDTPTVHLAVRRYDVADVTGHEQIARRTVGDQFGNDARVGAGNEHRPWRLGRGEFLEELFLLREDLMTKMQKAINDMSQRCIGRIPPQGRLAPTQPNGCLSLSLMIHPLWRIQGVVPCIPI